MIFYQVWSVDFREVIFTHENLSEAQFAYANWRLTYPDEVIMLRKVEILEDSRDETKTH